ncbi:MAG: hypothetical protein UR46_C0021G0002 [Parcubacteria group bacterium GW2011_GWA1_33_6]|nr:MAG: hypothetical protein UR31_C0006G0006 [Parcubacteria group bacterium GW2011_GWA2_33_14]KKP54445.1 MAG: hypothetical protein UR46_C0021G0002 [Parcubacteria group bacterium GW2011_GWA1_33_6]
MQKVAAITIASILTVFVMAFTAPQVFAQNGANDGMHLSINASGEVNLKGTVSAVSSSTIWLTTWLGTWTVNVSGATVLPNGAVLSDIKVGDKVAVHGTMGTGMTVNATKIADHSIKVRTLAGVISNFNAPAGTLTLTGKNNTSVAVETNSATKVFINGVASVFGNLANGMTAAISGSLNTSTNVVVVDTIKSPAPPVVKNDHGKFKRFVNLFPNWHKWIKADKD